jgi:hypothetical protein
MIEHPSHPPQPPLKHATPHARPARTAPSCGAALGAADEAQRQARLFESAARLLRARMDRATKLERDLAREGREASVRKLQFYILDLMDLIARKEALAALKKREADRLTRLAEKEPRHDDRRHA